MEEKKESVNVSPDPSEQRAPLSSSADEAQAHSAGSASMDPAKCGAHEIHCIEQEAELAEARVRERVRTEAAEAERALDNAAHCASAEQKNELYDAHSVSADVPARRTSCCAGRRQPLVWSGFFGFIPDFRGDGANLGGACR